MATEFIIHMKPPEEIGLEEFSVQLQSKLKLAIAQMRAMEEDGWVVRIVTPGKPTIEKVMRDQRRSDGLRGDEGAG